MNGLSVRPKLSKAFASNGRTTIIRYLRAMRRYSYFLNTTKEKTVFRMILRYYWGRRFYRLGLRLGFSIGPNVLGYGVVIPHYGTIVINGDAHIGNFAVLHTCVCVAGGNKEIGDFFYLSTGSQLVGDLKLGDGVTVAAHSLVNKSVEGGHVLLVGAPAQVKRTSYPLWIERDGESYALRVEKVNKLQQSLYDRKSR